MAEANWFGKEKTDGENPYTILATCGPVHLFRLGRLGWQVCRLPGVLYSDVGSLNSTLYPRSGRALRAVAQTLVDAVIP